MTKYDTYIHQQLAARLQPGEAIACTGFLIERSLAWASVGMIGMLGRGYHFAAMTDRRLFLIATRLGFWGVKMLNDGVIEIAYDDLASVQVQNSALVRTVHVTQRSGATRTLRYSGVFKVTASQERFLDLLAGIPNHAPTPAHAWTAPATAPSGAITHHAGMAPQVAVAQPATGATTPTTVAEQLKALAALHRTGVLTDEEYGATRAELVKRL